MEKLVSTLQERKKKNVALTRNSKLFKTVINSIQDKKGEAIVSMDLRKIDEAVADFFVLSQAQTHIQVNAIADNVIEEVKKVCGETPYHVERGTHWTLIDYVNLVVHIFQEDMRKFYDLEALWADAAHQEHLPENSANSIKK